jgi:threonine dehydrogenase-like Zn-dependent dehydrogenase
MTGGRGPDRCIEAVGMEAHTDYTPVEVYDKAKQLVKSQTERPQAVREAILACANGGSVAITGVYGGFADKFPLGSLMNRSLTVRTGQTPVHRYLKPLYDHVKAGRIDPTFIISHRLPLEEAPKGYDMFKNKKDNCTKVVLSA